MKAIGILDLEKATYSVEKVYTDKIKKSHSLGDSVFKNTN